MNNGVIIMKDEHDMPIWLFVLWIVGIISAAGCIFYEIAIGI